VAKRNGARLAIINRERTPYDDLADAVIHGQAGSVMTTLLKHVKKEMEFME
jgi:NAD-dependent deacetylase